MTEQWNEYVIYTGKPLTGLVELNTRLLNNWTNNSKLLRELMQARNSSDFIAAQSRFVNNALSDAMQFAQNTNKLWLGAAEKTSKVKSKTKTKKRKVHVKTKKPKRKIRSKGKKKK